MKISTLPAMPAAVAVLALVSGWLLLREQIATLADRRFVDGLVCVGLAAGVYALLRARDLAVQTIETRLDVITELHTGWYWEIDEQLRLMSLKGQGLRRLNIDPMAILGKPSGEVFHFSLTEMTAEAFAELRAQRKPYRNVRASILVEGKPLYVSIDGDPVFSPDGAFRGYRGLTREITAQVETEIALQESERRFRQIVETAPNLLFFITTPRRDRWVYRSPNWRSIWNIYEPLSPVGPNRTVLDRILPEDRPLYDNRAEAESRGEVVDIEYRFSDPDRGIRWLRTRTVGVPRGEGDVEVYGVTEDVTESRQALEKIHASETLQRTVLASMAEGLIIRDLEGRITAANRAAEQILGREPGSLVGNLELEPRSSTIHEDGSPYPQSEFPPMQVMRSKKPALGAVMGSTRGDGSLVWIRVNSVPLLNASGALEGVISTFQDISAERAAQAQLSELAATLERRIVERTDALTKINRELEAFAHSVSHDLRAPLRAINGFARLLADREGTRLDNESRRLLSRIEAGAGRMGELIDDVIEYSSATRRTPVLTNVDLDRLVRSIIARMSQAYPATRFEVEPLGELVGDARMLEEILSQLLGNALKFSAQAASPKVRVWAEGQGCARTVFVSDNGAGFDMAHAGHLFHLFRRLHHEHEFPGTGVGLATVRNLVEQMGGKVTAHGEPGIGARFSFRLGEPAGYGTAN